MSHLNVLLVVYAFPPAGGVGTLRAASLARHLPPEGIRLDVLTTRNPSAVVSDRSLLNDIPPEVTIHRTITLDLPFALKKSIKSLIATWKSHPAGFGDYEGKPGAAKRFLQDMLLPDPQVTWLPVLTRSARRIVREREIDLVVITGAPFSDYLLSKRLRATYPDLPIVLDFRDEWLTTSFGDASFGFSRSERARQYAVRAEAEAIASASAVVSVTKTALREIRARYPDDLEKKYHYIPNGFDATRVSGRPRFRSRDSHYKVVVTYVGTLYNSTDPTSLVAALHSLSPAFKARLILRFIGHIEDPRYRESLLSLGDMVELKRHVPQREALNAMDETDYALLISHDRVNVSAKFYDYLGSRTPILACIHPDGDIRHMLEDMRAGWWADSHDTEGIRKLFIDAVSGVDSLTYTFQPNLEEIAKYERKPLARRYAALLHAIAKKRAQENGVHAPEYEGETD